MNAIMVDQTRTDQTRPDQPCALISVIIPAYNTEKYIARCLDSVLAQTYKNLEVIVIDDGSTDSTGSICDEYARKDERMRVIHQANQGQAVGRNIGLREARGEWIQFVDSDDWIDPETIETCYKYAHEYNADIVCFQYVQETPDGKRYHFIKEHKPPELMSISKALSVILIPQFIDVSPVTKLAKKNCYIGVKYPAGKAYEDMYTTYKVIANAKNLLYITDGFYHYCRNTASTMGKAIFSEKTYGLADAAQETYDGVLSLGFSDEDGTLATGMWFYKISVVNYMIRARIFDMDYVSKLQHEIKYFTVLKCPYMPFVRKVQIILFKFNFKLYSFLFMRMKRL